MKKINVVPYNPDWPKMFEAQAKLLKSILGKTCLKVIHFGSTAVENLCSKNTIDIICVVQNLQDSLVLEKNGFTFKGEINIPLRLYFDKHRDEVGVNLHVVEPNHGFIETNLSIKDYLRAHAKETNEYAKLKQTLLKDPTSQEKKQGSRFSNYNHKKNAFIKSILEKAQCKAINLNFCIHDNEWQEYHSIRKELIFDPIGVEYDPNHFTITAKNHFHFVLYQGSQIVSVAHLELIDDENAALRSLATISTCQKQGLGSHLLTLLETWLKYKRIKTIKLHAYLGSESFYKRRGYSPMTFDDPTISNQVINLGKHI